MQLNFTLVVGVSSFIESCSWGLRSIRRMGKSDSAAEVKVTEHFDDGSVIEHPADLGLFFFLSGSVYWAKLSHRSLCLMMVHRVTVVTTLVDFKMLVLQK